MTNKARVTEHAYEFEYEVTELQATEWTTVVLPTVNYAEAKQRMFRIAKWARRNELTPGNVVIQSGLVKFKHPAHAVFFKVGFNVEGN